MIVARTLTLCVMLALVTSMGMFGCVESRAFYFPSREPFETPRGAEDVSFATPDGLRLHGWFLRAKDAAPGQPRPTILHIHGNAGNLSGHINFSGWLTDHGFHVLAFDYRGYGRSDQPPKGIVRAGLLCDSKSAFEYLKSRSDVDADRIGVLGVSLGGVIGLALAADEPQVKCMVAAAAFSSWRGIASEKVPLLGPLLVFGGMDAIDSVSRIGSRPLLLVHGRADTIIPPSNSQTIATAARRAGVPVQVLTIPNVGHNDLLIDDVANQRSVAGFFGEALSPDAGRTSP